MTSWPSTITPCIERSLHSQDHRDHRRLGRAFSLRSELHLGGVAAASAQTHSMAADVAGFQSAGWLAKQLDELFFLVGFEEVKITLQSSLEVYVILVTSYQL